jgi:hypothetical protein
MERGEDQLERRFLVLRVLVDRDAAADGLMIDVLATDSMASMEGEESWEEAESSDPWTAASEGDEALEGEATDVLPEERAVPMASVPATRLADVDGRGMTLQRAPDGTSGYGHRTSPWRTTPPDSVWGNDFGCRTARR